MESNLARATRVEAHPESRRGTGDCKVARTVCGARVCKKKAKHSKTEKTFGLFGGRNRERRNAGDLPIHSGKIQNHMTSVDAQTRSGILITKFKTWFLTLVLSITCIALLPCVNIGSGILTPLLPFPFVRSKHETMH